MMFARLSDRDNYALAVFGSGADRFSIVVGNIMEGDVDAVNELLHEEATDAFGDVKETGSAKGSAPGRWDAFVVVASTRDKVMQFVKERLGGSPNQMI